LYFCRSMWKGRYLVGLEVYFLYIFYFSVLIFYHFVYLFRPSFLVLLLQ
jgi:hypothetical protein